MFESPLLYSLLLVIPYLVIKYGSLWRRSLTPNTKGITNKKSAFYDKSKTSSLEPMPADFQWDSIDPIKSYPFKNAAYKLTMGIKSLDVQDWLLIEPTYLDRIEEKTKIVTNNHPDYPKSKDLPQRTVFLTDECIPAVHEFYDVVVNYMCTKYPMYFTKSEDGEQLYNSITKEFIPSDSSKISGDFSTTRDLLLKLVRTIEEDFIILLKDPTRENEVDGTEYFFKGGVFAFAAGFNPNDRFNKPLSFIHHPIPGYESKLKVSMNRFFDRILPGQFVTRSNFSMQTHSQFYVDDKNKGHNNAIEEIVPLKLEDIDFEKEMHYRSERQVLTKLPKTGAVVFTIRTYLQPLSEVKRQGPEVRERLVGAIKGFPEEIALYKRSIEWGPAVIQYLEKDV
ncbi:hypothetical protein CAAN3_06S07030 [[Candida] anglica]